MVQTPTPSSHPFLPASVPISFALLLRLEIMYPAQSHPLFMFAPDAAPGTSLCPPAPFPALYRILFCTFTHAAFLSHLRREKKVSCSHFLLPLLSYFSALFCCRTSGKSCLCWLSAVLPLPFSVKARRVRCLSFLPILLPTLPKLCPARSLSNLQVTTSGGHFSVLLLLVLSQHLASSSPRKCSFLAFQGALCLGFFSFHSVPLLTSECWGVPGTHPWTSLLLDPYSHPC